ncbi:40S ribosomal protein S29-like [Mesocricetus auratus]|uniref:40S ribosomal protein S29-like n=1 Tax=Mesocricetus auratus TaxID=10036 RepID=A0ABM2XXK5_MESAU|nr:40S ribosomal protein S29-like [Mesocricetus auratus]
MVIKEEEEEEKEKEEGKTGHQQLYWKFRQGSCSCCFCSNHHSLIWKHGLNMCFRQYAKGIGFIKLD